MIAKVENHSPHSIIIPAFFSTKETAKRLGASAVKNIELVTQVAAIATHEI